MLHKIITLTVLLNASTALSNATPKLYWLPMCFLFAEEIEPPQANEHINTLIENYQSCGIEIVPFAFYLASVNSQNEKLTMKQLRDSCPFQAAYRSRGSTLSIVAADELASELCGNEALSSCSTQCQPDSVAVTSAKAPQTVAIRESLKMNCCGPLCVEQGRGSGYQIGFGLELSERPQQRVVVAHQSSAIHQAACPALISGAKANWEQAPPSGRPLTAQALNPEQIRHFFLPDEKRVLKQQEAIPKVIDPRSLRLLSTLRKEVNP